MAKGYWIVVGAKPLHVIDETFCSIPTDDANYRYLDRLTSETLAVRYKPTKKGGHGRFVDEYSASDSLPNKFIHNKLLICGRMVG